jgi:hypothetical protein
VELNDEKSASEKLLLVMHNLCLVRPKNAETVRMIANAARIALDKAMNILNQCENAGYVRSILCQEGTRRFYLTGYGILRVCSSFT